MELKNKLKITGKVQLIEQDIKTGKISVSKFYKNTIVTSGKTAIARRLANIGLKPNEGVMTYIAVGDDDTPVKLSDTSLGHEIDRVQMDYRVNTDNEATLRSYFGPSDGNGTWKEIAIFGEDASDTPNSGTMFNRVLVNKTKTSAKAITVVFTITIS